MMDVLAGRDDPIRISAVSLRICLGCFINFVNRWKLREQMRLCSEAVLCSLLLGWSLVLR